MKVLTAKGASFIGLALVRKLIFDTKK